MYLGKNIVIATKHQKEQVIAPLLLNELGLKTIIIPTIDTDTLGTFTGEVERTFSPIETAIKKCEMALQNSDTTLAIASEGSFGPHPSMYFINADDELLVFYDKENKITITAREVSTETNFNAQTIETFNELKTFTEKALFPTHGLILRDKKDSNLEIQKGISSWAELEKYFTYFKEKYGKFYIETDMRAMYNPTRMKVIEKATLKLIDKIKSTCPECNCPGFSITSVKRGLPCMLCNMPTQTPVKNVFSCQKCNFEKEEPINQKQFEDPMNCNFCNP